MSSHNRQKSHTKVTTTDYDHNGVPDYIITEDFIYDKEGQLLSLKTDYDFTPDGGSVHWSYLTQYEYDNKSRVTKIIESSDDDAGGTPEFIRTTENTYQKDNLVTSVVKDDYGADGAIDTVSTTTSTYKKGLITQSLTGYDYGGDGSVEQSSLITYEYDGKRLVKESTDTDNNGIPETIITYTPTSKNTKSYDKVITNDGDADGIPESIITEKYLLDRKGNLTSLTTLSDYDANGSIDYGTSTEYTRDKQGRITKEVYTADEFWDGTPDYVQTLNTTYGKDGVSRTEFIMDYNGGNDYRWVIDNTYNKGLLKSAVTSWDFDQNGAIDQTDTVSYFYEGKNLIREEQDYYTDGTVEAVISYDYLTA